MNRSELVHAMEIVATSIILLACAGVARAEIILRITGQADVVGRNILGEEIPLGTGPYALDLSVTNPMQAPTTRPGQDEFSSAFFNFQLNAPAMGFPRGGQTVQNFILAGREGEPDADFVNFGVFDCISSQCGFPVGSINNTEALAFEGMFGVVELPDGALGSESFSDLGALLNFLDALDLAIATETFFDAMWVPESLVPDSASTSGTGAGGDDDVLFLTVNGTISDIIVNPDSEPLAGDYNQNGFIDAADYTVWRDTLGSTSNLAADGDGDNQIDAGDYEVWKSNFGNTAGSGSSAIGFDNLHAAVPEPFSLLLIGIGVTWPLIGRARSRK